MAPRCTLLVLVIAALAAGACGEDGDRRAPAAARDSGQSTAPSVPCDDAIRRALEAQARDALAQMPREKDGIVYSQMNSGCAMLRVPPTADSRP